jgi:hypothetical protein
MTNRSDRGSVKPRGAQRLKRDDVFREPIRGLHQGQQPCVLRKHAGHMDAPDQARPRRSILLRYGGRLHMA